ncbi:uncharacterized protein LOC121049956 [Rosa chinensis]|uniref:uncharacterized protein LOC121049956 n=1 Tax=Rosa chinensis TaxID=74649 RepID=UPI001AD94A04|nr:uncharacterized protein LOC121049956 [Rosa chinensis]
MTITAKSNKAVSSTTSTNKSVCSKTKKSEEDDDENRTGGLKLLKRGMEIREAQIAKRKENKYPHRMSRKGYANLMEELSESVPLEELDRTTMWIKARQDRNGNFKQPEVEKKAEKIEHLRKREAEGEIATSGSDDVLTLALGNPEHRGRVRDVGGNVKPDLYFNLPKRQKMTFEQRTRLSLKKILEEEKEVLLAKERTAWEEERDRKLAEERAYWTEKIAKLEEKVDGKELPVESPKPVTVVNDLGSGQGSCSRQGEKAAHDNIEAEVKGVKKKLVLRDEVSIEVEEEIVQPSDERVRLNPILEEEVREDVIVLEAPVHGEEEQVGETKYKLAIDTVENIVAIGTVISVDLETKQQTIHGVPLGEENLRVSITETVVPEALLPFPIKDEIVKVKDAIGTCVAWPRNLVIAPAPGGKVTRSISLCLLLHM